MVQVAGDDPNFGGYAGGPAGIVAHSQAGAAIGIHEQDTDDAHLAVGVSILDASNVRYWPMLALCSGVATSGGYFASDNVEGALAELGAGMKVLTGTAARYWPMLALCSGPGTTYMDRIIGTEVTAPAAPAVNQWVLFAQDNGAGKTQLCVRFNTGAIQVLATQP